MTRQVKNTVHEQTTMAQDMEQLLVRLRELGKIDFPQYRSYRREDGTEVDHSPTPEHLERAELIRRWWELREIEQYFHMEHNHLLISLRLQGIAHKSEDLIDFPLQWRIATSVYRNTGLP